MGNREKYSEKFVLAMMYLRSQTFAVLLIKQRVNPQDGKAQLLYVLRVPPFLLIRSGASSVLSLSLFMC